jgi:hypothetical protein
MRILLPVIYVLLKRTSVRRVMLCVNVSSSARRLGFVKVERVDLENYT